ncbi:tRNase Z TRZ2, chloroplastic [Daucus carota subsp. sativus]|nr:PREDICTED: ribonuclease Z, chloroplastic [Daucus carota subsp. sativus]
MLRVTTRYPTRQHPQIGLHTPSKTSLKPTLQNPRFYTHNYTYINTSTHMYASNPSCSLPQLCKALTFSSSCLQFHQPNSLFPSKPSKIIKTPVLITQNNEGVVKIQALIGSGFLPAIEEKPSKNIKTHVQNNGRVVKIEALKGSGFLSAIGNAIEEEEEYRKARAEVNRKGADLGGYSVEGLSVGGHETCVIVPELKSAFDIGRCPPKAVHQNFLFITHAHLDHIGGLPMYLATRGLYNLKPPTVFVPPCIKDDVEKLIDIHRVLGQVELNLELVALDIGETYEMRNDLVVRPFKTHHVIPSQGYVIYSVRKKLKKQYMHLNGKQIEKLKKSGVEITDTILSPDVAFTGDTTSDFFLDPRSADALRANVLITEATFLNEDFSVEHARERGHTHIFEIMAHAKWIRNKTLLLTHFSPRYHIEDIRQAVSKLQPKVSAKVIPLTEGFKSMHA